MKIRRILSLLFCVMILASAISCSQTEEKFDLDYNSLSDGSDVYAIKHDGSVWLVDAGEYGDFCVETDFMSLGIQNPKSLKGVAATAELGDNSELEVSLVYANGEMRAVSSTSPGLQVLRTAVRTRRSDFAKVRLSGHGKVDMFGLSISFAYEDTAGGM